MDHRTPAKHSWLQGDVVHRLKAVFAADELRFVGGVVRDSLLGRPIGDIDAATTLHPSEVMARAKVAGLKAIPTGIDHGTVTLLVDGHPIEITTLRHDDITDGRRAEVSFHANWEDDALRRDFTMNALYLDFDGVLYDYFDGEADLMAGRVRFIGDAVARIHEDALRMLRFFRFYAHYGKGTPDADAIQAITDHVALADGLSVERIWREMKKILLADDPLPTLKAMIEAGLWLHYLKQGGESDRFAHLIQLERACSCPSLMRRLNLVLDDAKAFAQHYKLSRAEREELIATTGQKAAIKGGMTDVTIQQALYRYGRQAVEHQTFLGALDMDVLLMNGLRAKIRQLPIPTFPLQGKDLLATGFEPGKTLGQALKQSEQYWLIQDFQPTRDALITYAKSLPKL